MFCTAVPIQRDRNPETNGKKNIRLVVHFSCRNFATIPMYELENSDKSR